MVSFKKPGGGETHLDALFLTILTAVYFSFTEEVDREGGKRQVSLLKGGCGELGGWVVVVVIGGRSRRSLSRKGRPDCGLARAAFPKRAD